MSAVESKKHLLETNSTSTTYKRRLSNIVFKSSTNKVGKDGLSKCFQRIRTSLYLSLAPKYINNPIEGIKSQHLDPLLMAYYEPLKGVILSYFNVKLSKENQSRDLITDEHIVIAKVSDSNPFCFIWCTIDFLIWKPEIGDIIEGWSYMQSQSHIGLLIHDTFNASIKKYNIPSGWKFIPNQMDEFDAGNNAGHNSNGDGGVISKSLGQWVDGNEVPVEGKLRFTIKALHTTGKVISVEGTLLQPGLEKDAQPVVRESSSSHKKFNDDTVSSGGDAINDSVIDMDDDEQMPKYDRDGDDDGDADEDEDNKVVGGDLSSSEDEDSD